MFFIDYGNSECVTFENLAPLPNAYRSPKPFVHEYGLACVRIPQVGIRAKKTVLCDYKEK